MKSCLIILLCIMDVIGGHGKEIQKNRKKETGSFRGTTARAHEVG